MKSLFDNEARYYDIFHQDKDYRDQAEIIRQKFPNAKTVLEVGAGTGNLTAELEDLGFEVTCIEPSGGMLKYFKGENYLKENGPSVVQTSIQDYEPPEEKFDLVLATYDVLNYVPREEQVSVLVKMVEMGREIYIERWKEHDFVRPLTYKRADGCHRLRLGFRFGYTVCLWFIFWGKGLVISHHRLYL